VLINYKSLIVQKRCLIRHQLYFSFFLFFFEKCQQKYFIWEKTFKSDVLEKKGKSYSTEEKKEKCAYWHVGLYLPFLMSFISINIYGCTTIYRRASVNTNELYWMYICIIKHKCEKNLDIRELKWPYAFEAA
jgi:hypothetical protein